MKSQEEDQIVREKAEDWQMNGTQEPGTCHTVVFYSSRTGTAEQYARWIQERREADIYPVSQAKLTLMKKYSVLVFVLSVYEGKLTGLEKLSGQYDRLMKVTRAGAFESWDDVGAKRVAVVGVGAAREQEARNNGELAVPSVLSEIPVYYARGRWQPQRLDWKGKMTVELYRKALSEGREDSVPVWARELIEGQVSRDFSDPVYLDPVIDFIDGRG